MAALALPLRLWPLGRPAFFTPALAAGLALGVDVLVVAGAIIEMRKFNCFEYCKFSIRKFAYRRSDENRNLGCLEDGRRAKGERRRVYLSDNNIRKWR